MLTAYLLPTPPSWPAYRCFPVEVEGDISQENLEEIDPSNIVPKRTRGKKIDYSKVPITADDGEEEDEEDEDFEDPKNGETEDVEMKD